MSEQASKDAPKSEDKKDIEVEERERMLNEENKNQDKIKEAEGETVKVDIKEGMEVKPKKIPIGGIQMPGFFTRSKSKEKCKEGETDQQSDTEPETQEPKEELNISQTQTRVKLPNPFRKSRNLDESAKSGDDPKERKRLLNTIRLPLVSVFPRKRKVVVEEGLESQAVLASMETLGDNDKSADKGEEMKQIPLDDKTDLEKDEENPQLTWRQRFLAYRVALCALFVFVLLLAIIILVLTLPLSSVNRYAPIRDNKYVVAVTTCGPVEGLLEDGAVAFRGVPYAQAPLGENRFKFAQPLNGLEYCWNGTLLAHNSSETCLQIESDGNITGTEDCLTLDIVTPYVRYENPLPVIVLIGAETLVGGSPGKMRPSARYARSKDVVFVRPNFRMGALGFLALKTLSESDYPRISGNYGLSDIVTCLQWIQLNIENFGGDKKSVILFGHRAGATLVTALTTLHRDRWDKKKLFSRAWATSGSAIYPTKRLDESEVFNRKFLAATQCDGAEGAACLRKMPAEKLVSATPDVWRKGQPDLPPPGGEKRHEWLVVDGHYLREPPAVVWGREEGQTRLVLGTTAHACATEKLRLKHQQWTEDLVKQHLTNSILPKKDLLKPALKTYPLNFKGLVTLVSDLRTVCPLFEISRQMQQVAFYVVTQTRGNDSLADVDSDVDAILGRYEPKTPEQRRYVSEIQNLFYHFVWHDDGDKGVLLGAQQGKRGKVLVVDQVISVRDVFSHCDLWVNNSVVLTYADVD